MESEVKLTQLVDLAINNENAGSVNFTHLRALLLGILKLTNNEESVVGVSNEKTIKNGVENTDNDKQDTSVHEINNNDTTNVFEEIKLLHDVQTKTTDQLSDINKTLNSLDDFPSNENILQGESSSEADTDEKLPSKLGVIWQNKKMKKRLEASEEGIDKLFSIMNDLLKEHETLKNALRSQQEESEIKTVTGDTSKDIEEMNKSIEELKNSQKELEEQVKGLSGDFERMKTHVDQNQNQISKSSVDILKNSNDISNLSSKFLETSPSNDIKESHTELTIQDKVEGFEQKLNDKVDVSEIDRLNEDIKELSKQITNLQSQIKSENSTNVDSEMPITPHLQETIFENKQTLENMKNLIDENMKEIQVNKHHAVENTDQLNTFMQESEKNINTLNQDIEKLNETLSNMDNDKLQGIMENFDHLQNMSKEIDDLRKLSDLKDLADNVESLKDIRKELNDLKETVDGNNTNLSSLLQQLENVKTDIEEMKNQLSDLMKNVVTLINGSDGSQESQASNPADSLDSLKVLLEDLGSRLNQLKERQDDILNNINSQSQQPAFDTSVLAAIQNLAQQNRQQIAAIQAELNILRKIKPTQTSVTNGNQHNNSNNKDGVESSEEENDWHEMCKHLQNHLDALQEEQTRLSGHMMNTVDDMKDEFNRKQTHIDALYDYIDKLQHNKADREDINSEMDVKADKKSLDGKVNMSTFDERYQLLEAALQDALNRLDQYANQETNLQEALDKLNEDLNSKLDSDAEKKLKKFLESRLKEIQSSRTNLPDHGEFEMDMRNAAGLRKPMPVSYHCISCDRPIDVTMRGVMPPVPQNFPSKKSMGPYTSYELEQIRQAKKQFQPSYEKMMVNRACGGVHTSVNSPTNKAKKLWTPSEGADVIEKLVNSTEDVSVVDCVVGRDGQIYRGRFRQNERPPPLPKKVPYQMNNRHNKFHNRHKHVHSATPPSHKTLTEPLRDNVRSQSASNMFENKKSTPEKDGSKRNSPQSTKGELMSISLPPINREGSLVSNEEFRSSTSPSQLTTQSSREN